jgi:hypothetical protein
MTCSQETLLLISCYADGEATPTETIRAQAHLEKCRECQQLVEDWRGQRVIFEWAFSLDRPVERDDAWKTAITRRGKQMSFVQQVLGAPRRIGQPISLRRIGAVAVVLVVVLASFWAVTRPRLLETGQQLATGAAVQRARLEGGVQIAIGPDSLVTRIDQNSLRLTRGWLNASVRHGAAGLRVITSRIEVQDKGTRFRVGSAASLDYVIVDEGLVSVRRQGKARPVHAGQILVAANAGPMQVGALPEDISQNQGVPLTPVAEKDFLPSTGQSLDWHDGMRRLGQRFPDLRWTGSSSGGSSSMNDIEYRCDSAAFIGIAAGLRRHAADIAAALAGQPAGDSAWEVPCFILQLSGVSSTPPLAPDVYLARLMCNQGKVFWRLTAASGGEADLPFQVVPKHWEQDGNHGTGASYDSWMVTGGATAHMFLRLTDWPGDVKPTLDVPSPGQPISDAESDRVAMLTEIRSVLPANLAQLINPGQYSGTLFYLDPARKHRLLIVWSREAGRDLCRLFDQSKKGRGGTVVLGAISTNVPLSEPRLDAGIYLVRFVLPGPADQPHLELFTPGINKSISLSADIALGADAIKSDGVDSFDHPKGTGMVGALYGVGIATHGYIPVHLRVIGQPDNPPEQSISNHSQPWAGGWLRLAAP